MRHTDMLQSPARQAVYRGTRSGGNALAEATTNVSTSICGDLGPKTNNGTF